MNPWYKNGLKFDCQPDCGNCCRGDGKVLLRGRDRERLRVYKGRLCFTELNVLPKTSKNECIFLTPKGECSVHLARPNQCRSFPFWDATLISRSHWNSLRFQCPGIGKGNVWTFEEIERERRRMT